MAGFNGRDTLFQPPMQKRMEDMKYSKGRYSLVGAGLYKEFTPMDIFGVVDWHRADMGITLVGSKVSAWADQSGNAHNLSQGTDSNRPTYVTNSLNGQPVIRYGTDLALSWSLWAQEQVSTIFYVIRMVTAGNVYQQAAQSNAGTPSLYLGGLGNAEKPFLFHTSERAIQPAALVNGTPYLVKWAWDFTQATNDFWYSQVNNGTEASTNVAADQTAASWQSVGIVGAGQSLLSDVAEIIIYNRRLSPSEDAAIYKYAKTRYNL